MQKLYTGGIVADQRMFGSIDVTSTPYDFGMTYKQLPLCLHQI